MSVFTGCPICSAPEGQPHDQARHEQRDREDWPERRKKDDAERPIAGLYDPPGETTIHPYVRSMMERRPDLAESILESYRAGLRGEADAAPVQPALPFPKATADVELARPRRPYADD